MSERQNILEQQLNDFQPDRRAAALDELLALVRSGALPQPAHGRAFNLHAHSFFSYNGYGYSPAALAWQGRRSGLYAMGIIDFDVLDGVDEFLASCRALELRACAGFETRIFLPEFASREINSPGEPGVSYHMGVGFTSSGVKDDTLLREMKRIAQNRTRGIVERINPYLDPVSLDYIQDVLPLTPNGNATERHVCMAYDQRARQQFLYLEARAAFWAAKLGIRLEEVRKCLDDGPVFQGLIRAKTMKAGGVGYVPPDGPSFPRLKAVNEFTLANGAIPVFAFLDGASAGEQALDELLDLMMDAGVAAVNVIPDRNWNIKDPETKKVKLERLYHFVDVARARALPVLVGTEMNAYGQRFVDDFDAPEMKPLYDVFLEGANILHAHTLLQAHGGMGYLSDWAQHHFRSVTEKNRFFAALGAGVIAPDPLGLKAIRSTTTPAGLLTALGLG